MSMQGDADMLAREYASEQFDPKDPRHSIARSAYLAGKNSNTSGVKGYRVFSIELEFPKGTVKVKLEDEIIVRRKAGFMKELKRITKADKVKVYGQKNV